MLTRSAFFRDAKEKNLKLKLIGGKNFEFLKDRRPHCLNPRAVVKVQTNAIYLEGPENDGNGSYVPIPVSSLMEYDGTTLRIYDAGIREMNEQEKRNLKAAEKEQEKFQTENPYSEPFWHMMNFYKNCSTPWIYSGAGTVKGKSAGQGSDYGKIIDRAIKGVLALEYEVI